MNAAVVLRLQRLESNLFATYGQLVDAENKCLCVTLELPWRYNAHGVSCIPPARYVAYRRKSPKRGYDLFGLLAVPGRSDIEIHTGNLPRDSQGCILVGTGFGTIENQTGVIDSRTAFKHLMDHLRGVDRFTLDIRNPLDTIECRAPRHS